MKKILIVLAGLISLVFISPNIAKADKPKEKDLLIKEIQDRELLQRQIAWELAPVKNQSALVLLATKKSPLDKLSPESKKRFIDSVVFTEKGIGGFYYGDLELELTPTEIYKVLSLIGQQHITSHLSGARVETVADRLLLQKNSKGEDYSTAIYKDFLLGYRCDGGHTCDQSKSSACTKNC